MRRKEILAGCSYYGCGSEKPSTRRVLRVEEDPDFPVRDKVRVHYHDIEGGFMRHCTMSRFAWWAKSLLE
jgi:hypothetical protein